MKTMGRLFFYLLIVAVLVFWTVFTVFNPEPLPLKWLNWQTMPLPISIWLLGAFVLGGVCGVLLCARGYFRGKATQKGLALELERRDSEEDLPATSNNTIESARSRPMSVANSQASDDANRTVKE